METDDLSVSTARAKAERLAERIELAARGEAGATVEGVSAPMRRRANISVQAASPSPG